MGIMNDLDGETSDAINEHSISKTQHNNVLEDVEIPSNDDPDIFDPSCDPNNPVVVTFKDISVAQLRTQNNIIHTPCKKTQLSKSYNMEIILKLDFQQVTGSFKERGVCNFLRRLSPEAAANGVVAASAGNHAQALAYHGGKMKIPVTVVMPINSPLMKLENCVKYGANVICKGKDMSETKAYALKLAKRNSLVYINGYDHPWIIAGQGTLGLEILQQVSNVDAILVPVGGGGLIAGVAVAVKSVNPDVQVIGIESSRCAAFANSLKEGKPVWTECRSSIADGLAVPLVGVNALQTALGLVDKMVSVDEEYIHRAIVSLLEVEKCVVEGGGATGLAAIMAGLLPELEGKVVVVVLSGGNIDTTVLGRVIERGLAFEGRMCRFAVHVSDRPGGIADLCVLLKNLGVSIKDIFHERAWVKGSIFTVQVKCVVETKSSAHAAELQAALNENYEFVWWGPAAI